MATAVDSLKPRESTALRVALWPRLFERWHLLSLDAPTVAALWAWFFARAMQIELPWHAPLLLAIGTWLVYVADRILDGARSRPATPLRERHFFHTRHRAAFLTAAIGAGSVLLWLIVARMSANARIEDTVLFSAALLYFAAVHKPRAGGVRWLPKELAVGMVFAAATAVPAWSRLGGPELHSRRAELFPAVVLFAALCWLNCVAIERWEGSSPDGRLQAPLQTHGAHVTTRWAAGHFRAAALGVAAISTALACAAGNLPMLRMVVIYAAVTASALGLAAIDRFRESLSGLHLRVAADAALLTPLILMPFLPG